MNRLFLFLSLLLATSAALPAQTTVHNFPFGGTTRSYRLYVPPGYTGSTAVPLVFNLHGYTSNALQQEFYSEMNAIADTAGFIICYPDGLNNSWNSGFQLPYYGGVDDVGFISVLIDSVQAGYNIDPARVYSCGMSNGGYMSYRLACDLEGRIAAIASVTGSMTTLQLNNCNCNRPMPVLEIHGTADGTVPYNGGAFGSVTIDSVLNYWRGHNQCLAPTVWDTIPDLIQSDFSYVTRQWNTGCDSSVEVGHFKVEDGGHTWPGASFLIPGEVTNQDIEASVEIWKFFSRFSHPAPLLTGNLDLQRSKIEVIYGNGGIEVRGIKAGADIHILDMGGRLVHQSKADASVMRLPKSGLASGLYLLRVQDGEDVQAVRVRL